MGAAIMVGTADTADKATARVHLLATAVDHHHRPMATALRLPMVDTRLRAEVEEVASLARGTFEQLE